MSYVAALEGIDEVVNPSVPQEPGTHEELEASTNIIVADNAEIESSEADTERFVNAAAALESMYQSSLPMFKSSSDQEARMLSSSVCTVANAYGFQVGPAIALEAVDGEDSTTRAQRIIAKIKAYALNLWNILINAFDKAVDWLAGFFQRVTGLAARLKAKAEKLRAVHASSQNKTKEGAQSVLKGRVASLIGVTEGTPQTAFKNLSKLVSDLLEAGQGKYFDSLFAAVDKLEKNESGDEEFDQFAKKIKSTFDPIFPNEAPEFKVDKADSVEMGSTEILPGNDRAYMSLPTSSIGIGYFRYFIASGGEYGQPPRENGLPVLSFSDIPHVLDTITDITTEYEKMTAVEKSLKDIKGKLNSARQILQRAAKQEIKTGEETNVELERMASAWRGSILRGVLGFVPRATAGIHQKTMSLALSKCQSAVYWVDFSLSQYQPKSA